MHLLDSVIRRAAFRIFMGRFLRLWLIALTAALGALATLVLARRLFGAPIDWTWTSVIAGAASVVGALAWAWFTRPSRLAVARAIDERANLREAISTALCVADRTDPWSRATVDDAAQASRRVLARHIFPARTPSVWPAPMVAAAVLGLLALTVPEVDLFGALREARADEQADKQLVEAKAEVKAQEDELKKVLAKIDDAALQQADGGAETPEPKTAEDVRLAAIKKLTNIQDRLTDLRQSDKALQIDALADKMSSLKQPGPGPLNEAVQALQQGDFKKAGEALAKLAEKMSDGQLSDADKAALEEQLKKLAEQLDKLAQDKKAIEQKLRELGLDPGLAGDPSALEKALEQLGSLTEAQKQALTQAAKAAAEACKNCQGMASALAKAAGQMQQGGDKAGAEGMGELAEQLSDLEMASQEMAAAEAAQAEVTKMLQGLGECSGTGQSQFNMWQIWSGKGRGEGDGSPRDSAEAAFNTKKERAVGPTQAGPKIGTTFVQGDQVIGTATAEFTDAVTEGQQAAAEAIDHNAVPREFQDAVKRYFGRLERKVKPEQAAPADGQPAKGEPPADEGSQDDAKGDSAGKPAE